WATAFAPGIEWADARTVGLGELRGADAVLRSIHGLFELIEEHSFQFEDVLALESGALLARLTHTGIDRASGGAFERRLCWLWIFGTDGLVTRFEQFDAESDAQALARFDSLTAKPARRVRPNAATAHAARLEAAVAGRQIEV